MNPVHNIEHGPRSEGRAALSTEELVARARRTDHEAFEELYRRFHPLVIRRLTYLMGPACSSINDLAQDTFAQAFQSIGRFRGEGHFGHWVLRIASNVARSNYRRRRRSLWSLWDRPEREARVACSLKSVDETYPTLHAVHQALGQLSDSLREAVVLFELEGLSLAEMSLELDVPLHTAASRVRRGREKLRRSLERMGYAPLLQAVALCSGEPQ